MQTILTFVTKIYIFEIINIYLFLFKYKTIIKGDGMDSRTSSILLNLKLNLDTSKVANQYFESKSDIEEAEKGDSIKEYTTLTSVLKESYLTGCLKYGNNFVV